ncbi:hypothetical protein GpartN1_g7100.t1 [Galdieria partita]|uniref:Uncharacterized protein n=1 Tax=Galdieria partita TaxID=83374 RepID=A0A9C7UTI4_9RHOD|nr:hypothetical protein GpartN1_g7100.t1 [Galdieria partita]
MSFNDDIKGNESAYITDSYGAEERALGSSIASKALKSFEYQQRVSTAAFVSHYDKTSSEKCFDTTSTSSCGRGSTKDWQFIKQRPWSESASSAMYGRGNNREGSSKNSAWSFTRYSVVYRPSFRLWKKCSATCARTITSVSDLYEMAEQHYVHKDDRSMYTGQQRTQRIAENYASGRMKIRDSRYLAKHLESQSTVPMSSSLTENTISHNDTSNFRLQRHTTGADSHESEQPILEKSAAISRATTAAFEAILPYITFEEAQSLRAVIASQSPSVALNAVMQVAQSCKKASNTNHSNTSNGKDSLQKLEGTWEGSHPVLGYSTKNPKLLRREQDAWLTDFSISTNASEVPPVGSPSVSSSIGSSASGPLDPLAPTSAWVSPFLTSHSVEQCGEPWDIEHCASEMEELDLLGKTLHEEANSSGDHRFNRRSRFFPVSENITDMDSSNRRCTSRFHDSDVFCRAQHEDMIRNAQLKDHFLE